MQVLKRLPRRPKYREEHPVFTLLPRKVIFELHQKATGRVLDPGVMPSQDLPQGNSLQ